MKSDIPSLLVQVRINELNSDGGADGGFWCWLKNSSQPQTIVYHYQHLGLLILLRHHDCLSGSSKFNRNWKNLENKSSRNLKNLEYLERISKNLANYET